MFFRNYKSGKRNTARLIFKKLQDSKSLKELDVWLRRNYPDELRGDKE